MQRVFRPRTLDLFPLMVALLGGDTIRANHAHGIFHWKTMYEMDNVAQNAKVYRVKWWRR